MMLIRFILIVFVIFSTQFAQADERQILLNEDEQNLLNLIKERQSVDTADGHCYYKPLNPDWDDECQRLLFIKLYGEEVAAKFEERFYQFQDALRTENKEALAKLFSYPFKLLYVPKGTSDRRDPRPLKIKMSKTKKEFIKNYDLIFNMRFIKRILDFKFRELDASYQSASIHGYLSHVTLDIFCNQKQSNYRIDIKTECQNPDVKIIFMNNDEILDAQPGT